MIDDLHLTAAACSMHAAVASQGHLHHGNAKACVLSSATRLDCVAQDPDPLAESAFGTKFSGGAKDPETLVGCRLVA